MAAKGLTQAQVAAQLGIDQGTVSIMLNGRLRGTEAYRVGLWRKLWLVLSDTEVRS